jgi:hypothetical protein
MKIAINTWEENIYEISDKKLDDEFLKEIKTYGGCDEDIAMYFMEHGKQIDCIDSGYTDNEPYKVIKEGENQ